MTSNTRKRIRAYKALLPGLRERVVAVALLLAMSMAMMASASFAWLTISRRPAVKGVSTTVAANGSLEIALATGNGRIAPGETQIGDSIATEGQTQVGANITWGNLINLSDPAYGLENLTMRPAQLNTASLLESPLYGAIYAGDGRITHLSSNFGYATWHPAEGNIPGYFGVSEEHGVRAISSTKIELVGGDTMYLDMVTSTTNQNLFAANMYVALGANSKYMPSLATMMGLYMTARMNPSNAELSNPTCAIEDIQNLRDMYSAFLDCFDAEADAIAQLLNLQLFLTKGKGNYDPYTVEKVYASSEASLRSEGLQITRLNEFIRDRNTVASDLAKLDTLCSAGQSLKWTDSGLNNIVNNLVDVGRCTIGSDNTPISSIGASNAMGYLSGTQEARITNGILYRFEERTGGYIQVKKLGISATVERKGITVPATVKANIQTTAPRDYNLFTNDLTYAKSLNDGSYEGGEAVAEDTYGLAVDLWVRTNAPATYLTLEGNVLSVSREVRAMGKDANGNPVELYVVTIDSEGEDGETVSYSLDLYPVVTTEDGSEVTTWYNADNHTIITEEELGDAVPLPKMETETTVTGFEGENRVWENNQLLSVDATTQGSGSCYVYYADSPEDQARSLKLLEAFNVAFVDAEGHLLATAIMDTQRHYAANGRVTVPLVLSPSDSINLGEDYLGNTTYAITALEKNVPTRITAIVYLDGTKLTNQEVLAASDIQGQLNIQFGSSQSLEPIGNEKLEGEERKVTATVSRTSFDYDTATEPMTTRVTVTVEGAPATTVSAFFLRAISSTQGSREDVMIFHPDGSGNWVADYTFEAPGNYILRTVRLDGVDYDLENPPQVQVAGFAVASLSCTQATGNHVSVMSAANSSTVDLMLKFATDDESKLPTTVQGRYLRDEDGSAVNVDFAYDSTTGQWTGSATFLTSGDYTLQYLVVNGEYMELDSALWQTASVTLGMRVAAYTTSPHSFKYIPSEMTENQRNLGMQVKIFDNAGNEMPGLSDVKLTYNMKGSSVKKMDADLTWNGEYYVGELHTEGPGIWQFGSVVVGSNVLTNATTYPTFTVLSPEPPEYYGFSRKDYQYAPGNDATMNVQITNSAAASVRAKIVKSDGTEYWVDGDMVGEFTADGKTVNNWSFRVPGDANGNQDGNWTLTELELWDAFSADGTAYTQEEPLLIDVSGKGNATKVVARVFVSFGNENQSKNFGKDATGNVTGAFMESHTVSGLNVDIKDFEGQPVDGISEVKLEFAFGNNSETYGGYTSPSLTNATADFTIPLNADSSGTHFVQSGTHTLRYAGSYYTTFSFKIAGKQVSYTNRPLTDLPALPANAPVFTVSSVKPSLTVYSASTNNGAWAMNGTRFTAHTGSGNNSASVTQVQNTYDAANNNLTVYIAATYWGGVRGYGAGVYYDTAAQNGTVAGTEATVTARACPQVVLQLSNAGSQFDTASFTIAGDNSLSLSATINRGDVTTGTFRTNSMRVGNASGTWGITIPFLGALGARCKNRTLFGTNKTVSTITMTYGGNTYTVTLDKPLTINNPA